MTTFPTSGDQRHRGAGSMRALVGLMDIFTLSKRDDIRSRTLACMHEWAGGVGAGIVTDGLVTASICPEPLLGALIEIAARGAGPSESDLPELGNCHTLCLVPEDGSNESLVLMRSGRPFTGAEITVAGAMSRMMALATSAAVMLDESEHATSELRRQVVSNRELADQLHDRHLTLVQRVLRLQHAVTLAAPQDQIVPLIVQQAGELFDHDRITIRLTEDLGGRLWTANIDEHVAGGLHQLGTDQGISGRAIQENALVIDTAFQTIIHDQIEPTSAMAAPIYSHGEIVGAMTVVGGPDRHEPHDEEDQEALLILAGYASVAITESITTRQLQESLTEAEWRASHDDLTGLPNRARMVELVEDQLGAGRVPVALYIDLDGFKTVNDLYGHSEGDRALVALADRLSSSIRHDEAVARMAGDEFVVLLPPMGQDESLVVARRLANRLSAPLDINGRQLALPPSIGIANVTATTAEELLDAADFAMYRAKGLAGERIAFFDDDLRQQRTRRVQIEQQLRLSVVDMDEFSLHYQPIVTGDQLDICGFEALIRWNSPELGAITPDEFIPAAEETSSITRIDSWVMRRALDDMAALDPERRLRVSVNLSPASFLLPNLREIVESTLEATGTPPSSLAIEITERVMLGDPEVAIRKIEELRGLGVSILLDDFGTGYSSLSYLTDLNISGVKIDRAFIPADDTDARAEAVLGAVVDLAGHLGFETIAEGVETTAQMALLRRLGCVRYQGFLFGHPKPLEAYRDLAARTI